jgi:branched-chain amino acid transport system ATP-binding protein
VLRIEGLTKRFDGFTAVKAVSLVVHRGETHAVIGPNGAGKSTLFNLITGHLVPDAGSVTFEGMTISGLPPQRIVRLGLGRSFQRINIFPRLTVLENVRSVRLAHYRLEYSLWRPIGRQFEDQAMDVLKTVGLSEDAHRQAGSISYGKQKQLELALALACEPRLLLLDEPTAGMSPRETKETIDLIAHVVRARGVTLLFTEHDMKVVFGIADRISVLHHGEIIASGPPEAIRNDPAVREVYLGRART